MKANCWKGKHKVRVEDVPDPQILNNSDAIVKVTSTAICGSDLHLYNGFIPTMEKGDILGHEFMGEVVEIGRDVKNLKVGDRVVVPFPIACGACSMCRSSSTRCARTRTPTPGWPRSCGGIRRRACSATRTCWAASPAARPSTRACRSPTSARSRSPKGLRDEQVLFLSDIFPTGYMGAEMCDIQPGEVIAVWGCGPVGQFAIASARMLGAERVIAIDRFPYRLRMAREQAGATDTINYEEVDVHEALTELTGGRGPDACIDAVGIEAHGPAAVYAYDRAKQALMLESDRPIALRQAILACRNGGIVSVIGVYGGFVDKFPMGAVMNRSLTIRSGQCHVQRYMKPLLERIERGEIDPSFVITHRMPLEDAPRGYDMFLNKTDHCEKVVLTA